jgi:hypothetical protein
MPMPLPMLILGEDVSKLGSVAARGQERSQSQVSVPEVDSIETCNKRERRRLFYHYLSLRSRRHCWVC